MKFKVGSRAILKDRMEDVKIVEVTDDGLYYYSVDRLEGTKCDAPDWENKFSAREHELMPWKPRRFKVSGDHSASLAINDEIQNMGTWAIKDEYEDRVVMYISSTSSRWQAQEIANAMNDSGLMAK